MVGNLYYTETVTMKFHTIHVYMYVCGSETINTLEGIARVIVAHQRLRNAKNMNLTNISVLVHKCLRRMSAW